MTTPIVALAVSGHGFGHAVRCAEVARVLIDQFGVRTFVRTDAPAWLFPAQVEHLPSPGWPLDVGVAQHDGLDLDIDETRRRWDDFAHDFNARAEVEAQLLLDLRAGQLGPHLDALLDSRAQWTEQPIDGAQCVARRVLELE